MRKFISVLLAIMLVLSLTTVAFSAYNVVDEDAPSLVDALEELEYDGPMARVYFQMPNGETGPIADDDVYVHVPEVIDPDTGEVVEEAHDDLVIEAGGKAPSWYNEFNEAADGKHYAGFYMWDSTASPDAWPGYRMEIEDYEDSIFYIDIPGDDEVVNGIFNNGVDGGTDTTQPIYYKAAQTIDTNMEGAYDGDYETLWGDTYNEMDFDGCIYVIDPNQVSINAFSQKQTCGANWYFYYGDGCYGNYRTDADEFVSAEENCVNPDHHHGDEPEPTEPEPTEPEPTEPEPTEPEPTEPEPTTEPTTEPTEPAPEPTTEPTPDVTAIVAGSDASIFGTAWDANNAANAMTKGDDGVYTKTYTVDAAKNNIQLKAVVDGNWIGDETGNNVTFNLTGAGEFTVFCDGQKTWVEGDIVEFPQDLVIESVTAVGNGAEDGSSWLNCQTWNQAAEVNHMTEADGVYTFQSTIGEYDTDETGTCDVQFKFAVNDEWTHNFGLAEGAAIENGVETAATYNGNNIMIDDLPEGTVINMTLDLTGFDFKTKTGAKMTISWEVPAEPTEPEPTEPEPTEPEPTEPAPDVTAVVAGSDASIFGTAWDANNAANAMTKGDDGVYTKTYTVDAAKNNIQLKAVVDGNWIGDETGNNVTFNLTGAGEFTVFCDGQKTWVEGDIVEFPQDLVIESVTAVGNGAEDGSSWLNCQTWNQAAEVNHMTEADGVYTFQSTIGEYDTDETGTCDVQFKFAVNDEWTHNFGLAEGAAIENGVETAATYNGNNIMIDDLPEGTVINMTLDLTGFDFKTKTGAKMTISWEVPAEPTEPEPTEPEPTEPAPEPTEPAPQPKPNTFYLIGNFENYGDHWTPYVPFELTEVEAGVLYKIEGIELKAATLGVDQYGNPIKNPNYVEGDPDNPEILGDNFKVGKSSKRGTTIADYYPDGVDNNRTVAEDGTYTIWFRPNGDGDPADGWIKVYMESDPEGNPAAHGCSKHGGYMYKFVKEGAEPTEPEPTEPEPTEPEPTEPAPDVTAIVAGSDTSIFGTAWDANNASNAMTKGDDGVYTKTYTVDAAKNNIQLKAVVDGNWIGDETGNNVTFNLTGAGEFTVFCDGQKTWVEGDIVEFPQDLVIESVTAVGNGAEDGSSWLNCQTWNQAAEVNHMTEADGVYTFQSTIGEYDTDETGTCDVQFKFAVNDEWTNNFGLAEGAAIQNGIATDAAYNGNNIMIDDLPEGTVIKMVLDLRNFDFKTKTGAKMTITWIEPDSILLGDANGDGVVDIIDATLIRRFDAHFRVPDSFNELAADVDGDGEVTILDATFIQRYAARMKVPYAIGAPIQIEES